MAYNRYSGNSGRVERVDDGEERRGFVPPRPVKAPPPAVRRPPGPLPGMTGELGRLLQRLSPMRMETEDLLLILILYLLYRESGDEEFLITLGGYLFF